MDRGGLQPAQVDSQVGGQVEGLGGQGFAHAHGGLAGRCGEGDRHRGGQHPQQHGQQPGQGVGLAGARAAGHHAHVGLGGRQGGQSLVGVDPLAE